MFAARYQPIVKKTQNPACKGVSQLNAKQQQGTLTLLGEWQLEVECRTEALPLSEKGRALLAYLATEDGWHYREQLGNLLWPDAPASRANLRQALSALRAVLGDDTAAAPCLQTRRDAVRFSPEGLITRDATTFIELTPHCTQSVLSEQCTSCLSRMERAAALYRGEFMAGFSLPDCVEFEAWLELKRNALRQHALRLFGRLADCHEQSGSVATALAFAQRYTEFDHWDEPGQRRLMRLQAVSGNSGAALKQFETFAKQLSAELGVRPDGATRLLYEQVRSGALQPASSVASAARPERRQVTVLACEFGVAGVAHADPEDIAELLRVPQRQVSDIIRRNGGHLVQIRGGGLLAYFGYPQAIEDAALRAVRAALDISRNVDSSVALGMGVHTGVIVTGSDASVPDMAGQTSGIALRLRQAAAGRSPVLSGTTQALVAGHFRCEALGRQALQGVAPPIDLFLVHEETGAVTRLDAAARLTPLVGRASELAQLEALWCAAVDRAELRAVLMRGEAGIGKSRLMQHFTTAAGVPPVMVRKLYCQPEYQGTAFHPLTSFLVQACGFASGDDNRLKRDKLARYLAARLPQAEAEALPLLARLLGVAAPEDDPLDLSPQQEQARSCALLLQLIGQSATPQPQLFIMEDLHWADPSTLEWLAQLLAGSSAGPLFVLLSTRPEFRPEWANRVARIELAPLPAAHAAMLAEAVDPGHRFAADTLARIVTATDGVPLFIEEMARMLMAEHDTPAAAAAPIPATLHDLLAARLDRLGAAKWLAQTASVIGREFSLASLDAAMPPEASATAEALRELEAARLVSRRDVAGIPVYQFRHALIQEAAYQSQSRQARREAHRRIAQALKAQDATCTETPELLARHFFEAGEVPEAIEWWFKAGSKAAAHGAIAEAIEHFSSALAALARQPEGKERDAQELRILVEQGSAVISSRGYGSLEADRIYARALALSKICGASLDLFRSLWGTYLGSSSRTNHRDSMRLAKLLLQLARQDQRAELLIAAHYACANSSYSLARFTHACRHAEQARRAYSGPQLDASLLALFGEHVLVSALFFGAWSLWTLGRSAQALASAEEALAIVRHVNHPHTTAFAYCFFGTLCRLRNEPGKVEECSEKLLALAVRHGFALWGGVGHSLRGWALACRGDGSGVVGIVATIEAMRSGMFSGGQMYFHEMLIEAYGMLGRHAEQLSAIDEALETMERIQDRHFEAELYRLKGECLFKLSGNTAAAQKWLLRARALAQQQKASELEQRAIVSLEGLPQP
jgi:DNA-binding SARP family transcriptional activator/tetratricopeptide (TPR) repeat protein